MKALPFTIPKHDSALFLFQRDQGETFYDQFHQHEAIQISFIISGEGDLLAGENIRRFKEGDAFIMGSYLPHLFKSDRGSAKEAHMVSVFFLRADIKRFSGMKEFTEMENLLDKMDLGMVIDSDAGEVGGIVSQIESATPLTKLVLFFSLMEKIKNADYSFIAAKIPRKMLSENEGIRMQKVMNYTLNSFTEQISLDDIAEMANMSRNAFCRYFKQRTNKPYFQFLIEIRIEHACTLLKKKVDLPIFEVAESSGFQNLSNFNRRFKIEKGMTPSEFRRQIAR